MSKVLDTSVVVAAFNNLKNTKMAEVAAEVGEPLPLVQSVVNRLKKNNPELLTRAFSRGRPKGAKTNKNKVAVETVPQINTAEVPKIVGAPEVVAVPQNSVFSPTEAVAVEPPAKTEVPAVMDW